MHADPPPSWYHDGLAFECQGCGACCRGAPGRVFVSSDEILAMARQLGQTVDEFARTYVTRLGRGYGIRQRANHDCMLLDEVTRRCRVHGLHPAQCARWPFWADNLVSPRAWADAAQACPGIGKGPLHTEIEPLQPGRYDQAVVAG